jgi:hypothetical protein
MAESKWRRLCIAIMQEPDPGKLVGLVEALNRELEEREQQPWQSRTNAQDRSWVSGNG